MYWLLTKRVRLLLLGGLLLTMMTLAAALVLSKTVYSAPNIYPCLSPSCKSYNEWAGGTVGGSEILKAWPPAYCNSGCNWVQKGMWAKSTNTGTYIFLGTQRTQTTNNFIYDVIRPGGPNEHYDIGFVGTVSTNAYLAIRIDRQAAKQRVELFTYDENWYPYYHLAYITSVAEETWGILQTGTRVYADANSVEYYNDPFSTQHAWQCGSCGDVWVYQTNNGTFQFAGNAYYMYQSWDRPPSDPGSSGGIYKGYCLTGNCP